MFGTPAKFLAVSLRKVPKQEGRGSFSGPKIVNPPKKDFVNDQAQSIVEDPGELRHAATPKVLVHLAMTLIK